MKNIKEMLDPKKLELTRLVGERVKFARKALKLDQKTLAKRAKVSLTTINRLERGHQLPHPTNLESILSALGLDLNSMSSQMKSSEKIDSRSGLVTRLVDIIPSLNEKQLRSVLGYIDDLFEADRTVKSKISV